MNPARHLCLCLLFLAGGAELWGKSDGNPTRLIDGTTWQPAATYEYGPFGESLRASGPEAATNRHRYSGKFTDPATGLLYFGHRWYDPESGRWLSRDPLGEGGGLNLYGYAANDPINFVDALGLDREKFINVLDGLGSQAILGNLASRDWLNGSPYPSSGHEWKQWDLMLKGRLGKIAEESAAFTEEEIMAGEKAQCIGEFAGKFQDAWRNDLAGMKADYGLERQMARNAAASISPIDRMTANMKANFASDIQMAVWISTYDQLFVALGGTHYNPWAANAHDPGAAWQQVTLGEQLMTGVNLATLPLLFMPNPCRPLVAPKTPLFSSSNLAGVERASQGLIDAVGSRRTITWATEGSDTLRYLNFKNAEAAAFPASGDILLRMNPSKPAVLEEFLHGTQSKLGIIDRLGRDAAESHVKDFMIRHQKMLGLSPEDVSRLQTLKDMGL